MSASVFGPCTVRGTTGAGHKVLCSFDDANVLQKRAVLCPRCRRRVVRKRLVRPRLDTPWPGWIWLPFWMRGRRQVRVWPHVRARGEWLGRRPS